MAVTAALLATAYIEGRGWMERQARMEAASERIARAAVADGTIADPLDAWQGYAGLLQETRMTVRSLFGLQVRTIVIDPGHGGRDPGTVGAAGSLEKRITLDIARRLARRLRAGGGYRVLLTRETDETLALQERVEFANRVGSDLFISIHVNALPQRTINLVETYYFGPTEDPATLDVARQENQGSDYPIAGFEALLTELRNTLKWQESRRLALSVQRSLFENGRMEDADLKDWGVKTAPFVVLLGVESPAVLTEVACLTNPEEERKMGDPRHREALAARIQAGIDAYLTPNPRLAEGERGDDGREPAGS